MRERCLFQMITLKKPSKVDRLFFQPVEISEIPINHVLENSNFVNHSFTSTRHYLSKDRSSSIYSHHLLVEHQLDDTNLNIDIGSLRIPTCLWVNDFIKGFIRPEYPTTHALIVDLQHQSMITPQVTSSEVQYFIKKIQKYRPLLPIVFIINNNAENQFLEDMREFVEELQVHCIYNEPNEVNYQSAIELAARLSSRPGAEIQSFYTKLHKTRCVKYIPKTAQFEKIIRYAQRNDVDPRYRRIVENEQWLTHDGQVTPHAQKLIENEQYYTQLIKESERSSRLVKSAAKVQKSELLTS